MDDRLIAAAAWILGAIIVSLGALADYTGVLL